MLRFLSFFKEQTGQHHVITFMRANPPTAGHEKVVDKVLETAKRYGATHGVVLSHSQDTTKNPLSPQQKLKHARRAFPRANVEASSPEHPTILHHAVRAYQGGAQHLHVVVGQDRVAQFTKLLKDYNGKESKHGMYNFKSINVHSAGDRDPDAEDTTGISATKMRQAAKSGDRATFHAGASSAMSEKHKDEMMKDVRNSMGIREETNGGSIGGLGFNSGNPAVVGDEMDRYAHNNMTDADTRDNILKGVIDNHHKVAAKIGFRAFDPTKKGKK